MPRPAHSAKGTSLPDNGTAIKRRVRCAVYTRKSTEEGLELEFNSLDAQREACEAYIVSQRQEGWTLVPDYYDDGGFSGANIERPALKRLLAGIEAGRVDVVVVYKIDRLSRSLMDFSKLVDVFDRNSVTFVSITQSFNTTTSMGRLTLNILLSFAQFEREVIGERIRDKFAASRRKGMWMGGSVPLGYQVKDRKLVIHGPEAKVVRTIFERFVHLRSGTQLCVELRKQGVRIKSGKLFDKGSIYKLLNKRVYVGEAVHKGQSYPGEHKPIISRTLWDRVHAVLQQSPRQRAATSRSQTPALLKGLIFGSHGEAMSPTHTRKGGKLYRYYISQDLLKGRALAETSQDDDDQPGAISTDPIVRRVPAGEIEAAVIAQVRQLLRSPEMVVGTWRQVQALQPELPERQDAGRLRRNSNPQGLARKGRDRVGSEPSTNSQTTTTNRLTESDVRLALRNFDELWDELFPAEQARIVSLLVERVDIFPDHADIKLRVEGMTGLIGEIAGGGGSEEDGGRQRGMAEAVARISARERGHRATKKRAA